MIKINRGEKEKKLIVDTWIWVVLVGYMTASQQSGESDRCKRKERGFFPFLSRVFLLLARLLSFVIHVPTISLLPYNYNAINTAKINNY